MLLDGSANPREIPTRENIVCRFRSRLYTAMLKIVLSISLPRCVGWLKALSLTILSSSTVTDHAFLRLLPETYDTFRFRSRRPNEGS